MKKSIILGIISCLLMVSPLYSQQKIGVVAAEEIYVLMPEFKKADSALMAFQQSMSSANSEQENEVNAMLEKFVRDSSGMSPAAREATRSDLTNRIAQLKNKQDGMNNLLEIKKEELVSVVRGKLVAAIEAAAREKGYTLIIYKESVGYVVTADDITPLVKKKLGIL